MRKGMVVALPLVAALCQVTWGPRFEMLGAFPNLVLITVVAIAWVLGPRAALLSAAAGGLLLDLASAGPVGPHALALLPGVYTIGFWARRLDGPDWRPVALTATTATLFYSGILVTADVALGMSVPPFAQAARIALGAAVLNGALSPLAFALVRSTCLGTISRRAQA